jgi:outer membrane receptor protein involved in Fe transport
VNKFTLLGATALRSVVVAGFATAAFAAPAAAQTTSGPVAVPGTTEPATLTPDKAAPASAAPVATAPDTNSVLNPDDTTTTAADGSSNTSNEVLVTGSRIRRPNLESNIPVTSIIGEQFFQQGQNNVGDTLNDLPQLRSTFAQQNPGAGVGIAGLNLLDLRGLGTVRTLVLVNGRRHVGADILNNAVSPDVNTIPNDLIERVDIVTGGNSAVYGSDAIAGVVNFILRRDFNGLQLRANAGISEPGGYAKNQFGSVLAGKNFADGRGNITASFEYAHQDRVYASEIPFLRQADGFATVDADSPGLFQGSDGFPDAVFVRDIRSATNNRFGIAVVPQPAGTGACGFGTLANNGPTNTLGTAFGCNFIFDPSGGLAAQTGTRIGTGPGGTFLGGNGQTGREGTQLSILPFNERYNTNLLARFEVSPALEFFFEGKYSRVNATGNQLGPTFINNTTGSLGNDTRITPRLDNPFLSAGARSTISNAILANNCGFAFGAGVAAATCQPLSAAGLATRNAAVANGSYRFLFARNLTDLPDRDENFQRDTYRAVVGARGTFNSDLSYEISANMGTFKERDTITGFVNRQRFLLSLDAARNPATGQIQCRSQFDPAAARGAPGYADSALTLASDIAACVPYNVFGAGDNQAAANYFNYKAVNRSELTQFDVLGFVNGDSSQLFELPGGPIRFVLGGEYRREKAFNNSDVANDTGISNGVYLGDVNTRPLKVKEGFAELELPLLKDVPLFHELTAHGAGRVSDYNSAVGRVYTYNVGLDWAPVRDVRFRGNYGQAIRAPNVSESSFPSVPNFANGFIDPCNQNAIGNNPDRAINCRGQLSPAQLANLPLAGYSIGIISGSNPNLKEEQAKTLTVGAVISPRMIPGLTISADYFRIRVKNVISSLSAQTIVNSCYDAPGFNSPLCGIFQRNLTGAPGPNGELPGQILFNTLVSGPQNFASRIRRGLDVQAGYRHNVVYDVRLDTNIIYTHQFQNSNFENPSNPKFENRLLSELGDPQDEFRWDVDLTKGPVTLGYTMHYLSNMFTSTFENFNSLNFQDPLNIDAISIQKYPAVFYHNLRLDFRLGGKGMVPDTKLTLGVDNVLNRKPPYGTTATGAGSAIYSIRGRAFYAAVRAKF